MPNIRLAEKSPLIFISAYLESDKGFNLLRKIKWKLLAY